EAGAGPWTIGQTDRAAGNCDVLIEREAGAVGEGIPADAVEHYVVGPRIAGAHIVQGQAAAGLATQRAAALVPLIAQTGARGRNTEAGAGPWTIGQAHRRAGNRDVLIHRQSSAVGDRVAAHPADHYAMSFGIRRGDIIQDQAAGGLTPHSAAPLVPLIAQTGARGR